jgi:serine protease Do
MDGGLPEVSVTRWRAREPGHRQVPARAACALAWPLLILVTWGCSPDANASQGSGERVRTAAEGSASPGTPPTWTEESPPSPGTAGVAEQLAAERSTAIVRAAARVAPSVVTVNVIREERVQARGLFESFFLPPGATRRTPSLGSGIIIDADGTILTNDHVVAGADRIMVTLPDGRDLEARLVGTDEVTDLAVLRVEASDLPVAPLGTSRGLLIGEWTVAIGNPFGNLISNAEPSVTAGVVSAMDRHIIPTGREAGAYLGMIQTDASINPGNSGGPLVNALGEVIGVNSSIFSRGGGSEGLGFAIPIDRALRIADDLMRHGTVRRAWLGLNVEAVEADEWGRTRGVRVARVSPGGPAARGGVREGARLLTANGKRLITPLDFESILLELRAGDQVSLDLEGGAVTRIAAEEIPSLLAERVTALDDLELITLTPAIRAEQRISSETGAIVVTVAGELARQLPFRPGDVIVAINNTPIREAQEVGAFLERLRQARQPFRIYFEREGRLLDAGPYRWS